MASIGCVEVCDAFAGKFKMLLLVMANRNMSCSGQGQPALSVPRLDK